MDEEMKVSEEASVEEEMIITEAEEMKVSAVATMIEVAILNNHLVLIKLTMTTYLKQVQLDLAILELINQIMEVEIGKIINASLT